MPNYALVQNGTILRQQFWSETPTILSENKGAWLPVIDSPPTFDAETQKLQEGAFVVNSADVTRQYTVVNLTEQEMAFKPFLANPEVSVGRDQFLIALKRKGFKSAIEAELSSNPGYEELKIFYDSRPSFNSHNPLVISMAIGLDITPVQVAEVFMEAQTVSPD